MTPQQHKDWANLIRMCESDQKSINVGGKRMREMLIAMDKEWISIETALYNTEIVGKEEKEAAK